MIKELRDVIAFKEPFLKSIDLFGTPQFLIVEDSLRQRAKLIKSAFQNNLFKIKIFYAYKANDLPYICQTLHTEGLGAEVASDLELSLALKLGQKEIVFNGPGKTDKEIELAIKSSAIIIVDNFEELSLIDKISSNLKTKALIGVRLATPFLKNKYWSRFGIKPDLLPEFLRLAKKEFISFKGLHFHIGTEIRSPDKYAKNMVFLKNILRKLADFDRSNIRFINIGGGFGVNGYIKKRSFAENISIESFSRNIAAAFKNNILALRGVSDVELWLEPGRWIVDPAIHLLTKVLYTKDGNVILDSNISLCHRLWNELHPAFNLSNISAEKIKQRLFGCSCRPDDIMGRFYFGNKLMQNDIVCLANLGAYNNIHKTYFIKPLPKIISLSGKDLKLITKEETFEQRYLRFLYP